MVTVSGYAGCCFFGTYIFIIITIITVSLTLKVVLRKSGRAARHG